MGPNRALWAKGKIIWPRKYLSKRKPHFGIPRRPARGKFVPRTQAEEKGKLGNMDGQLKTSKLLI